MGILLVGQMFSHILPSDTKLTLQGNYYGLYMFEANHQCRVTCYDEFDRVLESADFVNARYRCDPWVIVTEGQHLFCRDAQSQKIKITFIHSINGGPFYEIVNEPDLCSLHYKPFEANPWIRDENSAAKVGRPLKNYYR